MTGGKPLIDVLKRRKPQRRPIWFMRQAGRYLPEYRRVREQAGTFLDLCYNPELAAEVTMQPLARFDLDAAILFADILVVPHAMGLDVRFEEGEGPIVQKIASMAEVQQLRAIGESQQVKRVCQTVGQVKSRLRPGQALIGFCGGPWTVASYMVEGGTSDRSKAKLAALERLPWFDSMIGRLVTESVEYLGAQIEAGAEAVQLFDSWAGELAGETAERYVVEPLAEIVSALKARYPEVPVIVFARGFGVRQPGIAQATRAAAVGLESDISLDWAVKHIPAGYALQGNLDPVVLHASHDAIRRETVEVISPVPMGRHIFNLGHGIQQGTDPEALRIVIDAVRAWDETNADG